MTEDKIQLEIDADDAQEVFEILCRIPFEDPTTHDTEPPTMRQRGIEALISQVGDVLETREAENPTKSTRVYVASSWKNTRQPGVCSALRERGYDVYDFRASNSVFNWHEIDEDYTTWNADQATEALNHELVENAFNTDLHAMMRSDVCVLLLPAGSSAHLEAGYFVGAGKDLIILTNEHPETMYKLASSVCTNMNEVFDALDAIEYEAQ